MTITDLIHRYDDRVKKYRRGLSPERQRALDDLSAAAYKFRMPQMLAGFLQPFEGFLLSVWLEDHVELMKLREMSHDVKRLRGEVENLRRKLRDKDLID